VAAFWLQVRGPHRRWLRSGYKKDPDNHIAVRGYAGLDALPAGEADHAITGHLPRGALLIANCAPFPPTSRPGTPNPTGASTAAFRPGDRGQTGDRSLLELGGGELVLTEGRRWRKDIGSRRSSACDPGPGRADRPASRTHGASRSCADPSATLLTGPDGHPALLVSHFLPREGTTPGESGRLVQWREL
jgi:hypothetical protein